MSKQKRGIIGSFFRFILYFILFLIILGFIICGAAFLAISTNFPDVSTKNIDDLMQETSFIYDDQDNISEKIQSNVYRTIVPIEDIPMKLQKAFIAIEDERFYEHSGIDVKRLFGALIHDIKVRSLEQGASTITMQLSKNIFTSADKSMARKITDMVYAREIEKKLNKTQILYAYLNTVFLGSNVNGVQAAAKSYFDKNVSDLNLEECAIIAGITKYPTKYIPYKLKEITPNDNFENIQIKMYPPSDKKYVPTENDKKVYEILRSTGKIDNYEYILLKNGSLVVAKAELNPDAVKRSRVVLKKMLELTFINKQEYDEALKTNVIIKFPPRNNSGISTYFNDKVKKETIKLLIEQGNSEEKATNLLKFGGLKIYTTLSTPMQKILENEFNNSDNFPNSYVDNDGVIQPQGAMVIIDQKTGFVKALIGGRGQAGSYIYDRADNPRQPGSAIKPLAVYLLALKDGMTPYSIIHDAPMKDPDNPKKLWPRNIYNQYFGDTTMKKLLEYSSNVAAVKTLESLGDTRIEAVNRSLDFLEQMGFSHLVRSSENPNKNDEHLSLALGGITKGVTPIEMASGYSGIANLGKQVKPTFIRKILDANDNVIYENSPQIFEMVKPVQAYQMTDMLVGVVREGTARSAILNNMPSAGKTGTTDDKRDVYFVGYTPYYTASVWMGADNNAPLTYSSAVPAQLWAKVMNKIDAQFNLKNIPFEYPSGSTPIGGPGRDITDSQEQDTEQDKKENDENNRGDQQTGQGIDDILFNEQNNTNDNNEVNNTNNNDESNQQENTNENDDSTTNTNSNQQPVQNNPQPQPQPKPKPQNQTQPQQPPEVNYEDTSNNENSNNSSNVVF